MKNQYKTVRDSKILYVTLQPILLCSIDNKSILIVLRAIDFKLYNFIGRTCRLCAEYEDI